MEQTVIRVEGMSCQGCVKNLTGVLAALSGVGEVSVSLDEARATVSFDAERISREQLCAAIEDAGFDAGFDAG